MRTRRIARDTLLGYALVIPTLSVFAIFFIYPLVYSLILSLYEWDMLSPPFYVGLGNYVEMFASRFFFQTLVNSVNYTVGVLILALNLGLVLALMLNKPSKHSAFFQACIFSSYIISWVAVALLWVWMLDSQYGLVNFTLSLIRLSPVNWLGDVKIALSSLVLVSTWKIVGYPMVIFLAGLRTIPADLYQAAEIDGASNWQKFRFITWPLLSPITLFLMITLMIMSFQAFDIVRLMTQGGPYYATEIFVYYIYETAFLYSFQIGSASAAVVVFFLIIFVLATVQWKVLRKKVHYL